MACVTCSDIPVRSKGQPIASLTLRSHADSYNGVTLQELSGVLELHETGYPQWYADVTSPRLQICLLHEEESHEDISKDAQYT